MIARLERTQNNAYQNKEQQRTPTNWRFKPLVVVGGLNASFWHQILTLDYVVDKTQQIINYSVYACIVKHLYLVDIFIWGYLRQIQKLPNYEIAKYSFEFSYTIRYKWTQTLSMLVSVSSKTYIWMEELVST